MKYPPLRPTWGSVVSSGAKTEAPNTLSAECQRSEVEAPHGAERQVVIRDAAATARHSGDQ